jgi:hypothetical protein
VTGPIPSQTLSDTFATLTRKQVDDWIISHRIEDLTLDFKRAPACFETAEERKTLAKALSGFGNASGGLIVWGVRAVKDSSGLDAAQAVEPIQDPNRFISNLTSYSGAAVTPTIHGVIHRLIDDSSVAVTLVPQNDDGPYMANLGHGKYFTRSGSSFIQMEHFQIVDVMNRRRRPDLRVRVTVAPNDALIVGFVNAGRVSARAPYLELKTKGPWMLSRHGVDGNGRWNLPEIAHSGRPTHHDPRFGGSLATVVHPQTTLDVCTFDWKGPPGAGDPIIDIEYAFAAEDVPLTSGKLTLPRRTGSVATSS